MSLNSKNLLRNDVTTLVLRLAVVYVVMFIMQLSFYFIDRPYLGHIADWHEAKEILIGSLQYNTLSILWTNALFIFLSILPFHFREKMVSDAAIHNLLGHEFIRNHHFEWRRRGVLSTCHETFHNGRTAFLQRKQQQFAHHHGFHHAESYHTDYRFVTHCTFGLLLVLHQVFPDRNQG